MKTLKRFFATLLTMLLMAPIQAKAAEAAQPVVETENIQLIELKEGYYKEVGKDGIFNRNDEDGNLISSTKVEESLFGVNADLSTGWGQFKLDNQLVKGSFKEASLDTKGYFRCIFTTEAGVVYDDVTVKVTYLVYESWAAIQEKVSAEAKEASVRNSTEKVAEVQEISKPQPTILPQPEPEPVPPTPIPPQPELEPEPEPVPPTPIERPGNTGWTEQPGDDDVSSEVSRPGIGGWTD